MFKPLAGKIITVVGSSGYVGTNLCRQAVAYGARVNGISRRGHPPGYQQYWQKDVNWVRGDAMEPQEYSQILKESDLIVHTIGTLVDTTVFKRQEPGSPGSYEQMNRDTLISIADELIKQQYEGKIVYVSGSRSPPFLKRYLTTKVEAEQYLENNSKHLKWSVVRPGFIYSWEQRLWSVFVKYELDAWKFCYKQLNKIVPQRSLMRNIFEEFNVDSSVKLIDVIDSALAVALDESLLYKKHGNEDMKKIADQFRSQ